MFMIQFVWCHVKAYCLANGCKSRMICLYRVHTTVKACKLAAIMIKNHINLDGKLLLLVNLVLNIHICLVGSLLGPPFGPISPNHLFLKYNTQFCC